MLRLSLPMAAAAAVTLTSLVWAGDAPPLRPGSYEVSVRLELPHVEDMRASKIANICVTEADGRGSHGLIVLSDNNPLAKCPASNVRQDDDTFTFDIVCPGGNAAIASAKYVFTSERFEGRIAMKMGGKNMTMTESQSGRRIGECAATNDTGERNF